MISPIIHHGNPTQPIPVEMKERNMKPTSKVELPQDKVSTAGYINMILFFTLATSNKNQTDPNSITVHGGMINLTSGDK